MTPPELVEHLGPDERVLWWGRAAKERLGDNPDVPRAFLAGGIGLAVLSIGVGRAVAGAADLIATGALVLLGLAMIGSEVASVVIGRRHRRHSLYAVTSQRLLFLLWQRRGGPRFDTLPLTAPDYPSVRVNASGSGTISFKADVRWRRQIRPIERWTFEGIDDVRSVLEIYRRAADDLRRPPTAR